MKSECDGRNPGAPSLLALVPARGGSKGIPKKNVMPIAGKPLLAWTIEAALSAGSVDEVVVSTEDEEIAGVARHYGGLVPFMRPVELSGDEVSAVDVALHAIEWAENIKGKRPEYLLLLQPTSPLRTAEDIDGAVALAFSREAESVVSVCECDKHPFWTRRIAADGRLDPLFEVPAGNVPRQQLPTAYAFNGALYVTRIDALVEKRTFVTDRTLAYVMPRERSIDIDTPFDARIAELLLESAT